MRSLLDPLDHDVAPTPGEAPFEALVEAVPVDADEEHGFASERSSRSEGAPHESASGAAALEPESAADGRDLARLANVIVVACALAAGLLAAVLGMGGASVSPESDATAAEGRALATVPPLTWSNVAEGRFTGAFEPYLADRFPVRAELLELEAAMRRARGLGAGEDLVVYRVSSEALDLGADAAADLDVDDEVARTVFAAAPPTDAMPEDASEADRGDADEPEAAPSAPARVEASPALERPARRRRGATRVSAGILIRDGRAMQGFGGDPRGAPEYARTLNAIHEAVGDRASVYAVIVPTAQEFYLPHGSRSRVREERPNILATYARLAPDIRTVDVHAELAPHTAEDIYFRTDHHWTGLGAYYGYRAFCSAARLDPVPLERMERRVLRRSWLGSLYRLTRDPGLRPDRVEIAVPPARAEVRIPSATGDRVATLFDERGAGYSVFLSGDHPIMRVRTSTRNGRRAILVKNSYGNAFAVYLVSHYEELVFVDYRYFRGSLRALVDESERPTDLVFLNGALTANSRAHSTLIRGLLDGRR